LSFGRLAGETESNQSACCRNPLDHFFNNPPVFRQFFIPRLTNDTPARNDRIDLIAADMPLDFGSRSKQS
jgi:hypothetical protein